MLLFNSHLQLFPRKLHSWWFDPFIVHIIFSYRAIKIKNPKNDVIFKVYGKRFKLYLEYEPHEADTKINLSDLPNLD